MTVSRRDFLKAVGLSAAALGLSATEFGRLEKLLAAPDGPAVVWLQGAGCTGCSVSFLNRIAPSAPQTAADILIHHINLVYHPTVMGAAGEMAVAKAESALSGPFVLVVEGAVSTAFDGMSCVVWDRNLQPETFVNAVNRYANAETALAVVCVGNCAAWGGIPAAAPNPTMAMGVESATGVATINLAGCPPHPDWITWAIVQLLLNNPVPLDEFGRPLGVYGCTVHELCPRRDPAEGGAPAKHGRCLEDQGCRGEQAAGNCPEIWWNGGVNWCVNAEAPCIGCTNPAFPTSPILQPQTEGAVQEPAASSGRGR